jgi:uncharacterized protein (TIGR01777 family)
MIIVTGARGFIGTAVCRMLEARGDRVVRIGRGANADLQWPAMGSAFGADEVAMIGGARAVVHLAGAAISERWTAAHKRALRESRVDLTGALARAIGAAPVPPALISSSGVGIYGDRGDEWLTEASTVGTDFLGMLARDWEAATTPASTAGARVVLMRTGVVFGRGGGMLGKLKLPFSLGLGARLGSGRQWLSWIALDDVLQFVQRAIDDPAVSGAYNLCAPHPVTNAEFTDAFAHVLHRRARVVTPAVVLRAAFGEMADGVLLASQRVRPARLLELGFPFQYPDAASALRHAMAP